MTPVALPELPEVKLVTPPDCEDHDDECPQIPDKAKCWLYAPEKGMCPYLRAASGNQP